jgi:hypothetical protein
MYTIYLEYRGNNELLTKVSGLAKARAVCNQIANDCGDNFIVWYKKLKQ